MPPTPKTVMRPHLCWAWLFRVGLAAVFVLGMLASATSKPYRGEGEGEGEAEIELTMELGESGESLTSHSAQVRVTRRAWEHTRPLPRRAPTGLRAPRRLVPTAPEPPPESWPRPRRVPPPDDDDDDDDIG